MKKRIVYLLLMMLVLCAFYPQKSFAKRNEQPEISKEQLREIQTKSYSKISKEQIIKSLLNILQDDFYFISQADKELGFINANKEFDTRDKYIDVKREFGCNKLMAGIKRYSVARTEANINITPYENTTQIRVSLRKKILNMYNVDIRVREVVDVDFYNDFYTKLETELEKKQSKNQKVELL